MSRCSSGGDAWRPSGTHAGKLPRSGCGSLERPRRGSSRRRTGMCGSALLRRRCCWDLQGPGRSIGCGGEAAVRVEREAVVDPPRPCRAGRSGEAVARPRGTGACNGGLRGLGREAAPSPCRTGVRRCVGSGYGESAPAPRMGGHLGHVVLADAGAAPGVASSAALAGARAGLGGLGGPGQCPAGATAVLPCEPGLDPGGTHPTGSIAPTVGVEPAVCATAPRRPPGHHDADPADTGMG